MTTTIYGSFNGDVLEFVVLVVALLSCRYSQSTQIVDEVSDRSS